MSLSRTGKDKRRIGDYNHNRYVAEGVSEHRPTRMAPSALIRPLPEETIQQLFSRYDEIHRSLERVAGPPAYSDCGFILYRGDCCQLIPKFQAAGIQVDLTITSPPYNIGKEYESTIDLDEYVKWCSQWMGLIHQITAGNGSFWLNLGYLEIRGKGLCVPISYLLWDKSPFYLIQEVVWKYGAGVSAKRRLSPRNEKWLFYVKNKEGQYTFNLDEIRDPNVKYPNQKKNGKFRCNPLGKNPSDVWEFPKITTGANRSSKERTGHPAQFPIQVVERIVRASSNPIEVVLDPFAGSCSTGIGAVGLGRIFIGIETMQDYCEMAIKRFKEFKKEKENYQRQGRLF